MIKRLFGLFILGCLAACVSVPASPANEVVVGASLLDENFDVPLRVLNTWDNHRLQGAYVQPDTGSYHIYTTLPKLVFGLHNQKYDNTVIDVEASRLSDDPQTIFGVICRAQRNGSGYYFLISPGGDFSIRRFSGGAETALVKWQAHSAIHQDKTTPNHFRAVCVDNYLALYINDTFIADARDTKLHSGFTGLAAATLPQTNNTEVDILFDNLRVWQGD